MLKAGSRVFVYLKTFQHPVPFLHDDGIMQLIDRPWHACLDNRVYPDRLCPENVVHVFVLLHLRFAPGFLPRCIKAQRSSIEFPRLVIVRDVHESCFKTLPTLKGLEVNLVGRNSCRLFVPVSWDISLQAKHLWLDV